MQDKLQVSNAKSVILSDTVDIPSNKYSEGSATSTVTDQLNDTSADFSALRPGYIIHNTTDGTSTLVVKVLSSTSLKVADDIFVSGENYSVYDNNDVTKGALLYVGTGGNVNVMTLSGDTVLFKNLNDGQFMPVKVRRVLSTGTTASDIVALW